MRPTSLQSCKESRCRNARNNGTNTHEHCQRQTRRVGRWSKGEVPSIREQPGGCETAEEDEHVVRKIEPRSRREPWRWRNGGGEVDPRVCEDIERPQVVQDRAVTKASAEER